MSIELYTPRRDRREDHVQPRDPGAVDPGGPDHQRSRHHRQPHPQGN